MLLLLLLLLRLSSASPFVRPMGNTGRWEIWWGASLGMGYGWRPDHLCYSQSPQATVMKTNTATINLYVGKGFTTPEASKGSSNVWSHIRYCIWIATHLRRSKAYENCHFYDTISGKVVTTRIVSANGVLNTTSSWHETRWSMQSDSQCKQFLSMSEVQHLGYFSWWLFSFDKILVWFRQRENERSL